MLPLLGPSHLRDLPSQVFDRLLEPFYWYDYGAERWISLGVSLVDKRARLLPLDATLQRTYDPYGFIRDAYTQRRLFQVYDGDIPVEMLPPEEEIDEEFDDEPAAPDEPPQPEPQTEPQTEPQPG
jgi:phospholipid-binding lipoprotein MlaA